MSPMKPKSLVTKPLTLKPIQEVKKVQKSGPSIFDRNQQHLETLKDKRFDEDLLGELEH